MKQMLLLFLIFPLLLLFPGCSKVDSYFLSGNYYKNNELKGLFRLLPEEKEETRFVLIQQISQILLKNGDIHKQIFFLTNYVEKNPFDPYNSYYLLSVAESYEELNALPFAVHYYQRILNNHPDLIVKGNNIHFHCIKKLLQYVEDSHLRLLYYKKLLSSFEDQLDDRGKIYYSLAKTYEEVGDWDQAMLAYQKFLKQPHTGIPGAEDVYKKIEEKIDFYNADYLKWTVDDLDFLVKEIKDAIINKNPKKLEKYKAKVNFFSMPWEQKDFDENRAKYFNITTFLLSSNPRIDDELDIDSNSSEAYLRTSRWSYRDSVWYFYFRRIDFPTDPEIDGRWEWAGIYFGEKR